MFYNMYKQVQSMRELPYMKYSRIPLDFVLLGDATGKDILEIGSGDGFFTREYRKRTEGKVYGIDNEIMIGMAQKENSEGINYLVKDLNSAFDLEGQ